MTEPVVINLGNAGPQAHYSGEMVTLEERTWLTEDRSEAVPDGHPEARYLLGGAGDPLAVEEAERLGLLEDSPKPKRRTPAQDKRRTPAQDK